MFNPTAYWNTRPDGFPVLEIVEEPGKDRLWRFVPLRRSELTGRVTGPLASLQLTQTFGYTRGDCDAVLEAVYRFPLPGDAAVTGVTVRFGEAQIQATLKGRAEAEADYQAARQEGRQAALATRESPDVFTLQVAGLRPDEEVTVATDYVQLAREERNGFWSLRIPLTTSPRYVRGDEAGSPHASGQPLLLLRDPGHRFLLNLAFEGAGEITSKTHPIHVADRSETGARQVTLSDGEVIPDRDCVLRYRAAGSSAAAADRPTLDVFFHADDRRDAPLYFLAQVTPPRQTGGTVPREAVLLVDHSGSMQGAKWEASDWAVKQFLATLTERDTFALGVFHNTTRWMSKQPIPADARAIDEAQSFLDTYRDSGGTELGIALEQALRLPPTKGEERSRHVLIVTDAEVTDAGRLLRLAEAESRKSHETRRRISVLCIDAAPNSLLATELAERGGGIARFLTSRPDEEDITTALEEVLEEWAAPVVYGARLHVGRANVTVAGRETAPAGEESVVDLGDLAAGRPRWLAGRIPADYSHTPAEIALTLTAGFGRQERTLASNRVSTNGADDAPRPAVKALFGARRLLTLEHLWTGDLPGEKREETLRRLGYGTSDLEDTDTPIYAENRREEAGKVIRRLLEREALEFGLASAATAFVAVRTEAGKPVEATVAVANALPHGWSDEFDTGHVLYSRAPAMASPFALHDSSLMAGSSAPAPPPSIPSPAPTAPASWSGNKAKSGSLIRSAFARMAPGSRVMAKIDKIASPRKDAPSKYDQSEEGSGTAGFPAFTGIPAFSEGQAVLYDSRSVKASEEKRLLLPRDATLSGLRAHFPAGAPPADALDRGVLLLIYVDDLTQPRASVRLADLVRQGGERPLNIRRPGDAAVLIVLADENGVWSAPGFPLPQIEVRLTVA